MMRNTIVNAPRLLILLSLVAASDICLGQAKLTTLQSVFMCSITKYMEWPQDQSSEFIVSVLGESDVYNELVTISKSRKVGNKTMVIRKVFSLEEASGSQIVFIPADGNQFLEKAISGLSDNPTLVITEKDGLIKKGSDLNFVQRNDKLNFQINEGTIRKKGIKVSGAFTQLAEKS